MSSHQRGSHAPRSPAACGCARRRHWRRTAPVLTALHRRRPSRPPARRPIVSDGAVDHEDGIDSVQARGRRRVELTFGAACARLARVLTLSASALPDSACPPSLLHPSFCCLPPLLLARRWRSRPSCAPRVSTWAACPASRGRRYRRTRTSFPSRVGRARAWLSWSACWRPRASGLLYACALSPPQPSRCLTSSPLLSLSPPLHTQARPRAATATAASGRARRRATCRPLAATCSTRPASRPG